MVRLAITAFFICSMVLAIAGHVHMADMILHFGIAAWLFDLDLKNKKL